MAADPQSSWSLDPRLERDTVALGDLALSRVLIMNDANYPWLVVVPRRPLLIEILDLDEHGRLALMGEIARVANALKVTTRCDKLNIAALGNAVRQLHVHIIARFERDAAGARPVWGVVPPRPYDAAGLERLVSGLRHALGLA